MNHEAGEDAAGLFYAAVVSGIFRGYATCCCGSGLDSVCSVEVWMHATSCFGVPNKFTPKPKPETSEFLIPSPP